MILRLRLSQKRVALRNAEYVWRQRGSGSPYSLKVLRVVRRSSHLECPGFGTECACSCRLNGYA